MSILFDQFVKGFAARKEAAEAGRGEVRIAVMVDVRADASVVAALRAALLPQSATGRLAVSGFGALSAPAAPANGFADACVLVASAQEGPTADRYLAHAAAGVPCCAVVPASAGLPTAAALVEAGVDAGDVLVCDGAGLPDVVGGWLVAALPDRAAALGASFLCCRRARALAVARRAARDNALVGALPLFGGADLPVILATEVAMMLKMADAYGLPLDWSRLGEAAGVAASALGLRGAARLALRALPVPAFLVRAGVAAAGTYAVGRALMAYYGAVSAAAAAERVAEVLSVEPGDEREAAEPVAATWGRA